MLTDLTSNAWPQTSRGPLVLPGNHTVFSGFNKATLINVYFRPHFLPSIFQQLLSHTCFQREHSQASTCIPISSCTHVTCLPAHIKDEPFILLGKWASPLSHTITRMIIPSVIMPSVIPRLCWIMFSLSTGFFPSLYKHVVISPILKRKLSLDLTALFHFFESTPIRPLTFLLNLLLSKSPVTSTC